MKITHVKIRNYRNLRDIDIGLAETVAIIGENNSGKSNFLKAITLPFLTDDNTHISKKLSWIDINNETNIRENLAEELEPLLFENHPTKDAQTVKKVAYYYAGKMIEKYRSTREKKDAMTLLSNWEKIDSRRYGIIINLFEDESPIKQEDKIFVKSIDYIKGMEGEKCLFILTNDLAAHLFNNNTETNKTKNKLYVALTRSLNELSIYILKEVEDKYTKKRIQDFFERYL